MFANTTSRSELFSLTELKSGLDTKIEANAVARIDLHDSLAVMERLYLNADKIVGALFIFLTIMDDKDQDVRDGAWFAMQKACTESVKALARKIGSSYSTRWRWRVPSLLMHRWNSLSICYQRPEDEKHDKG